MLRSLYSGNSGMKVNQQKLDVTANNISNVGTTAFKGSRARFQDMLSQSVSQAQGASPNQGGVNGSQIGLGVKLAGIDVNQSQGTMTPTSSVTDLAVDGDGYFMVEKGPDIYGDGTILVDPTQGNHSIDGTSLSSSNAQIFYTRDGSFSRDSKGNFVTSDGYRVMGYSVTGESNTVTATGVAPTTMATMSTAPDTLTFKASPGSGLNGYTFVKGVTAAGTSPKATINTATKTITFDVDPASATAATDIQDKINTALASGGFTQNVSIVLTTSAAAPAVPSFSNAISGAAPSSAYAGGTPVQSIDANNRINFVNAKGVVKAEDTSLKALKIPEKIYDSNTGTYIKVTKVSIDSKGIIVATLDDQRQAALGQVALASFSNNAGLKDVGKNLNQSTSNSGTAVIMAGQGSSGQDNSAGYGDINSGFLEASNVDLTEQFTDMITSTRAFEANGKTISNADEILQTIINLKR